MIKQSSKVFYYDNDGCEEYCWVVTCDKCGVEAQSLGKDPGDASDKARKSGFKTLPAKSISEPSQWRCSRC